jgi:hypothetical protein
MNLTSITVFLFEAPIGEILHTTVLTLYWNNPCEHTNKLFRQNSEHFIIKTGGTQGCFLALRGSCYSVMHVMKIFVLK